MGTFFIHFLHVPWYFSKDSTKFTVLIYQYLEPLKFYITIVETMDTSITSSTELFNTEVAPIRNDINNVNDTAAKINTCNYVIQMMVHPFTIYGIRIIPSQYQTKLPLLLQQNHVMNLDNYRYVDNYQLQEWVYIWKRIKNIQFKHPGYLAPIPILILSTLYVLFVPFIGVYRENFLVWYCITVILMNVYSYVRQSEGNRFIMLYWRTILAITVNANMVARFAMVDTLQANDWQWCYWFLLFVAITMTPIGCINLCIPSVNAYCRYLARHDEVLRQVYYEILTINDEVTYFTLIPKVGFHVSNIAVDVYTGKQENGVHQLSPSTTTSLELGGQKSANCSNVGINDPLLL
jgi:hypothetical protein